MIAGIVFSQKYQMKSGVGDTAFLSVGPASRCDICFDTEDWLDVGSLGFRIEFDSAKHIAVVGNGHRIHL